MSNTPPLVRFTDALAAAVPPVDATTEGQYGAGLGSESEERQLDLLLDSLRDDDQYTEVEREVAYPDGSERCDLRLPDGTAVEAKLLRYWRANGDPEPNMYTHVFSPFHRNTLLTDARRLHESGFDDVGLLGLFYERATDDSKEVVALPERYTAEDVAEKVTLDIDHWYDVSVRVCAVSHFEGLRHDVHERGAVVSWSLA